MISKNQSPLTKPIPLHLKADLDLQAMADQISKLAHEREEKWLADCVTKIMPPSVREKVNTDTKRVKRWLVKSGIWVDRNDPSGDIKLMIRDKAVSILKAPQIPKA